MEIGAGIFLGLVALLLYLEKRAGGGTTAGAETPGLGFGDVTYYPAPPADDFANPEVGDVISGGSGLPVTPEKIDLLARAIATAEGFFSNNANVIPRRAHNPGDLTRSFGQPTTGIANAEGVLDFSTDSAGWSALKGEVTGMLTGASHVYAPSMTLRQVAAKYTGGDADGSWATNAARVLGISPDQTLQDFLNV
jgi:hypothetical protein